jgi:ATP-binding cassette subfamily B protein
MVALVGASGAGKTSVARLLLRFVEPTSGVILLGEAPLAALDPDAWRAQIGWVSQQPRLLYGTVADNLRLARPAASQDELEEAARLANALDFIRALPRGFGTPIHEYGARLSGGQRQRIAIARAILRDAPLLLLDEATSSLDAESETLIAAALTQLMQTRTTIVIAHRLATVLSFDRILVLDQGRIVEQGTHQALVAAGGLYARLAKLQFQGS